MGKSRKIGLDIHGVISSHPDVFSKLSRELKSMGYEVHILTGPRLNMSYKASGKEYNSVTEELDYYNIIYDELFSVLDYNISNGAEAWEDTDGWWTSDELWNKTKADYCRRNNIDLHIDDSVIYGNFFDTPFAHLTVNSNNLELKNISTDSDIIIDIISIVGDYFNFLEINDDNFYSDESIRNEIRNR